MAHGLNLPGCVASGPTPQEAMTAFVGAVQEWLRFLASAGEPVPSDGTELEVAVDEWFESDADVAGGVTLVCFAADLAPLAQDEIERGLRLLGELRGRTLSRVRRLPPAALDAETEGGWTARRILEELARAEWWTLSRLGTTPLGEAPDTTLGRLDTALALAQQFLGYLPEERRGLRLVLDGEEWTPRKVLRRLLWLEWSLGRAAGSALAPAA
jgi:predicted RNase H-like HicB family nuclease